MLKLTGTWLAMHLQVETSGMQQEINVYLYAEPEKIFLEKLVFKCPGCF